MVKENDTVVRSDLAATLSILANDRNALYEGDIAESIIEEVRLACGVFLKQRHFQSTKHAVPRPGLGSYKSACCHAAKLPVSDLLDIIRNEAFV